VQSIWAESFDTDGNLISGSSLEKLLKENEDHIALSAEEQIKYLEDMRMLFLAAASYMGGKNLTGVSKYSTGGLVNFTGPAWLDGTKSKPEYVLSAEQTEAFFKLIDVANGISQNENST
jgi:hypothetical protein